MNNRAKIFLTVVVLLLLLTLQLNKMIRKATNGRPKSVAEVIVPASEGIVEETSQPVAPNLLIPDDPAKYGIYVQHTENTPRNQTQWDQYMKKVLIQSRALDNLEDMEEFQKIKKSPREFQKRVKMINDRIKAHEKIVQNDPSNEAAQQKLQTLYMLRSTLSAMESKIVEKEKGK